MTIGKPHPLSLAKYEIQSDLLYELLTYSDGLPTRLGFSNWNVDHSDARPMMTLIAMRAFDLYRLPWHHDRCFSIPAPHPARLRALACVTDAMLVEAVLDTRRLYEHTQTALGKTGHSHIALNRSLYNEGLGRWGAPVQTGYASFVSQLDDAATRLARPSYAFNMDILSSWSAGPYGRHEVVLELAVPIEDIAFCSSLIASRDPKDKSKDALEGGEWIVLNRSIDGNLSLPSGSVISRPTSSDLREAEKWRAAGDMKDLAKLLDELALNVKPVASVRSQIAWRCRTSRASVIDKLRHFIAEWIEPRQP